MKAECAETLLLLDTCGERASLALARKGRLEAERELTERTASGALLGAVREMITGAVLRIEDLDGLGVVSGPGSFTGLRVGLAMAKGLCEATGVRLAAVSRLAVLADASGLDEGIAVLWAGRDQVYVREFGAGKPELELLIPATELATNYGPCGVAFAEDPVSPWLKDGLGPRRVTMNAGLSLGLVRQVLLEGGSDWVQLDANYVRNEETIYARQLGGR